MLTLCLEDNNKEKAKQEAQEQVLKQTPELVNPELKHTDSDETLSKL